MKPQTADSTRHVLVLINPQRFWRWQSWLVDALRAEPALRVAVRPSDKSEALPRDIQHLLSLERMIYRFRHESAADILPPTTLKRLQTENEPDSKTPDIILDLAGGSQIATSAQHVLTPLYDTSPDEQTVLDILLQRQSPTLSLSEKKGASDKVNQTALPAVSDRDRLTSALDAVFFRDG